MTRMSRMGWASVYHWVSWEIDNFNGVAVLLLSTECISF